jgi:hypothetical protein
MQHNSLYRYCFSEVFYSSVIQDEFGDSEVSKPTQKLLWYIPSALALPQSQHRSVAYQTVPNLVHGPKTLLLATSALSMNGQHHAPANGKQQLWEEFQHCKQNEHAQSSLSVKLHCLVYAGSFSARITCTWPSLGSKLLLLLQSNTVDSHKNFYLFGLYLLPVNFIHRIHFIFWSQRKTQK